MGKENKGRRKEGRERRREGRRGKGGRDGECGEDPQARAPKDHPTDLGNPRVRENAVSLSIHCIPMFSKQGVTLVPSIQQMPTPLKLSKNQK